MELDAKESEVELLLQKIALNSSDSASMHSGNELEGSGDELLGKSAYYVARIMLRIKCFKFNIRHWRRTPRAD